jgi:hypothetical protein
LIKRNINKGYAQSLDSVDEDLKQIYGQSSKAGKKNLKFQRYQHGKDEKLVYQNDSEPAEYAEQ